MEADKASGVKGLDGKGIKRSPTSSPHFSSKCIKRKREIGFLRVQVEEKLRCKDCKERGGKTWNQIHLYCLTGKKQRRQ